MQETRTGQEQMAAEAPNVEFGHDQSTEHRQAVTAFCQQCGRALTSLSKRQIGSGIFCEPCAAIHTPSGAGWTPVAGATSAPFPPGSAPGRATEPNPVLAGFLGLIPGVGAMYNGQYPKGVLHLIVFVVLVSVADNLNWVFWWFVWGWVFYQAFDAYHTAQARRDGQPLPDPFGWNELTERIGGGRNWPPATHTAARSRYTPAGFDPNAAPRSTPPPPPPPSPYRGFATGAEGFATGAQTGPATATFSGEPVPPREYASPNPLGPAVYSPPSAEPFAYTAAPTSIPYTPTFTGTGSVPPAPEVVLAGRQFPAAAAWLIALGVLFLVGNLLPSWRLDGRWFVPILLAGSAVWTATRRLATMSRLQQTGLGGSIVPSLPLTAPRVACALLGPSLLFTVAVLLAFQAAGVLLLRHSWPALLIVWGALLLIKRSRPPDSVASGETTIPIGPQGTDVFRS